MLADAFGAQPDQALADLTRGAAGNPSLVAELIRGLRDDDGVEATGGRRRARDRPGCGSGFTASRSGGSTASARRPGTCW